MAELSNVRSDEWDSSLRRSWTLSEPASHTRPVTPFLVFLKSEDYFKFSGIMEVLWAVCASELAVSEFHIRMDNILWLPSSWHSRDKKAFATASVPLPSDIYISTVLWIWVHFLDNLDKGRSILIPTQQWTSLHRSSSPPCQADLWLHLYSSKFCSTNKFLSLWLSVGAHYWRHQISHISRESYGLLVPDLVDYVVLTSRSLWSNTRLKRIASDIIEIWIMRISANSTELVTTGDLTFSTVG